MKNLKLYTLFILFAIVSCVDATDIKQLDERTDELVYTNLTDLQRGLMGIYTIYDPDGTVSFNARFTDNVKSGPSNPTDNLYNNFNIISSSSTSSNLWSNRYLVINDINRALVAADELFVEKEDLKSLNHIKAQLYALRALCHLDLFTYYTTDYTKNSAYGVINANFIPAVDDAFQRNTVEENVAFIKSDLDLALELVDEKIIPYYTVGESTMHAFYARLAILIKDYDLAIEHAQILKARYDLASQSNYEALFEDQVIFFNLDTSNELAYPYPKGQNTVKKEVIWNMYQKSNVAGVFYQNFVGTNDAVNYEASNDLYNQYEDDDIRKEVFFNADPYISLNNPSNRLFVIKYKGPRGNGSLTNNYKAIRLSEMYLILAEAYAYKGDYSLAAQHVAAIRTARFGSTQTVSYANLDEALDGILQERRLELCYEASRYIDLKRFNKPVERLPVDAESFSSNSIFLEKGSYKFTFPIPNSELQGNSIITQNPNY